MAYVIHSYKTACTGEPSKQAYQLYNDGMPQAREVFDIESAFAQAREVFRVFGSIATMPKWFTVSQFPREAYVPVIDVTTGNEIHRVYVQR